MEQGRKRPAIGAGPGNKTIATTLLELLAVRGRAAARERALRALGLESGGLAEAPAWLDGDALDRMLLAVDLDPGIARAIGHRLCAPDTTGLPLYGLGLATPEKAYRRIQALMPRARREAQWQVESMGDGQAELVFLPVASAPDAVKGSETAPVPRSSNAQRAAALHCALRVGMLEAIPGLYGLLPAHVRSTSCIAEGADVCRYAVDWQRGERVGLFAGAGVGLVLAAGALGWALSAGGGDGLKGGAMLAALALLVLGVIAGRAFDLQRQLAAVAGARRGHLALFDQVDAVLAEKLDTISRLDATLEQGPSLRRPERVATFEEEPLSIVDLRRLVARVIEKAAPQVADWAEILLKSDERLRSVACDPVQIEQVVHELLQNAIEASLGAGENPTILVSLQNVPRGVELAIEDQGRGMDSSELEETFDPFFDERPIGLEGGFGLPVCLRIVESHGGELRIANQGRVGTRVTVLLPAGVPELAESEEN